MHLVVLGAFWPQQRVMVIDDSSGINAPSGAGCFLTIPLGRGCHTRGVLMRLVVQGAF